VQAFESGKEKWPCKRTPRPRCKCGILARRGVVLTELGYGWFCGNSYGDYWVSNLYYSHCYFSGKTLILCILLVEHHVHVAGGEDM